MSSAVFFRWLRSSVLVRSHFASVRPATPEVTGVAIDVPERRSYEPRASVVVESTSTPGAHSSTLSPYWLKLASPPLSSTAETATHSLYAAG